MWSLLKLIKKNQELLSIWLNWVPHCAMYTGRWLVIDLIPPVASVLDLGILICIIWISWESRQQILDILVNSLLFVVKQHVANEPFITGKKQDQLITGETKETRPVCGSQKLRLEAAPWFWKWFNISVLFPWWEDLPRIHTNNIWWIFVSTCFN